MKKKIVLFIFIIIFVYAAGGIIYGILNKKPEVIKISNVDTINGYNYTLKSNSTDLYKSEFKNLKSNLESNEINDEEYAKSIAKLFIIDLYTLNNKINKYDIGGIEFVHPDYIVNYKLNASDTMYKYIEDNSNNNRNQNLPEVSSIEIISNEKTNYQLNDNSFEGYNVSLEWTYKNDNGYETKGNVLLIKIDNTYYIVEKN